MEKYFFSRITHLQHLILFFLPLFFLTSIGIAAEEIALPEDELARESVLPVFDKTMVVRNRAVTTEGRFEFGVQAGMNLLEPFYETLVYGIGGSYHFSETHGVNVVATLLSSTLSSNAKDLQAGKGLQGGNTFDVSLAPNVENTLFANYQITAYYGKISVAKTQAMNLSLYGLAGVGLVNWSDKVTPGLNVGFGQKLYFNPRWALRADLTMAIYRGPDPTSRPLDAGDPPLDSGAFDQTLYFRTFLTAGLVHLF